MKNHFALAVEELVKQQRTNSDLIAKLTKENTWIETHITTLSEMANKHSLGLESPLTPEVVLADAPRSARVKKGKWTFLNPPPNSTPMALRLREILFDGTIKSTHQIMVEVSQDPEGYKMKSPGYTKVMNTLQHMIRQGWVIREGFGKYRRCMKGVTNTSTPPGNSKDPNSTASQLMEAIKSFSPNEEFGTHDVFEKTEDLMSEKYPKSTRGEKISKVSARLAQFAANGKLIRVRPGVFKWN